MTSKPEFDYKKAFSRNIGWLTEDEQQYLRCKKIAVAGCGGVGGIHLLTLARLGIERFHVADLDNFEIHNFNRQAGAFMSTVDKPKAEVMERFIKDINPNAEIKTFLHGVSADNLDEFLEGVDFFVDSLDAFAPDIRELVYKSCRERNIPAMTVAPIGMGAAYVIILPNGMTFEEYYRMANQDFYGKVFQFLVGINPKLASRKYLVDDSTLDLAGKRGPSTPMACQLCAGVMGTEVLKILLNRGRVYAAPHYHLYDAYLGIHKIGWLPWGNNNPIQKMKHYLFTKILENAEQNRKTTTKVEYTTTIEKILDLARWAPSADNTQPWRFEIKDQYNLIVYLKDEADANLYDFDASLTEMMAGILIETIRLAATTFGWETKWVYQKAGNHEHMITINFIPNENIKVDSLAYCIKKRSVDRRKYQLRPLNKFIKQQLEKAVGDEFELRWFTSSKDRKGISRLNMLGTKLRMSLPELFSIHKETIITNEDNPQVGIPLSSITQNFFTKRLTKWSMQKWSRVKLLNKLGGITIGSVDLDLKPGIYCTAHVVLATKDNTGSQEQRYLRAGMALQRLWLTATKLGLVMQPSFTPIIFSYYAKNNIKFTNNEKIIKAAHKILEQANKFFPMDKAMFLGRIGYPSRAKLSSRSERLPLEALLVNKSEK